MSELDEDPDSGHPSPRYHFNPDEMTTSTPIPLHRGKLGRRPSPLEMEQTDSPRHRRSNSDPDYKAVNGVIEMVKENNHLKQENDQMRNQSMLSEQELEESRTKIAQLEEQVRNVSFLATIDLRPGQMTQGQQLVQCTQTEESEVMEKERREMEEKLRETREALENEKERGSQWELKCQKLETEREQLLERTTNAMKRSDALSKEKEEEMMEELKRRETQLDEMKGRLAMKDTELMEERRKAGENEVNIEQMREENLEMEGMKKNNEQLHKEMEELREKMGEMERGLTMSAVSTEEFRIRDLERMNRDLEKKITVAEQSLIDSIKHCEELKSIREGEMAETLELKTKVHEQISTIDNLRRINGELEERRKESLKTMEELKSKTTEGTRLMSEMEELRNDVERRRERQKRLEDELDIARKMTEDANREVNRVREEKEKENEQRRMEWMNDELRDSEDLKKKREKEREDSDIQLREALAEVTRYHHLYEELKEQYRDFHASAQHQYTSELEAKEEELAAMRDRLAEVENYPGKFVSIDGRFSEGRSLYDILPIQLKEFVEHITDEEVMRAVEFCKNMVIRGGQVETREEGEEMTPTPSYLSILIERLEDMEMLSSLFKEYRDFVVGVFKQMNETERTEELMTSLASKMEVKMSHLEEEWIEMEKRNDRNGERLRKGEEERNRLEDEAIRADDARKKALNELMDLRVKIVQAKAEKDTYQEAAVGFQIEYEKRCSELEEADETVEQLNERCHQLTDNVNERERRIRMLMEESNDLEKKLEDEIEKNSILSRQLVAESAEVHHLEGEVRGKKKELERFKSNKQKMHELIRELMGGLDRHYRVYLKVKGRNDQRRIMLDRVVEEIENTRATIGQCGGLHKLEETIRSERTEMAAADALDYRECRSIQREMDSISEDKENS